MEKQLDITTSVVRYRLRLAKGAKVKGLSHLEQIKLLKGALKASELPVAVSAARRALPRLSFGPALAAGHESSCEYLDVELWDMVPLEETKKKLAAALPEGYALGEGRRIPLHYPSVESLADTAVYELRGDPPAAAPAETFPILKAEIRPHGLRLEVRCGAKGSSHPERLVQSWPGWEGWTPSAVVRAELWASAPTGERLTP
jgi:hypothetical protein